MTFPGYGANYVLVYRLRAGYARAFLGERFIGTDVGDSNQTLYSPYNPGGTSEQP